MADINSRLIELAKIAKPSELGVANDWDISILEFRLGKSLPKDLKEFLLKWGGYVMMPPKDIDASCRIILNERKGGRDTIGVMRSLSIKAMIKSYEDWNEFLPEQCIVLEEIGDGSHFFISMKDGSEGEVYFMERDRYLDFPEFEGCEEDEACEAFDPAEDIIPPIFIKISDNFGDFINKIELMEA